MQVCLCSNPVLDSLHSLTFFDFLGPQRVLMFSRVKSPNPRQGSTRCMQDEQVSAATENADWRNDSDATILLLTCIQKQNVYFP